MAHAHGELFGDKVLWFVVCWYVSACYGVLLVFGQYSRSFLCFKHDVGPCKAFFVVNGVCGMVVS